MDDDGNKKDPKADLSAAAAPGVAFRCIDPINEHYNNDTKYIDTRNADLNRVLAELAKEGFAYQQGGYPKKDDWEAAYFVYPVERNGHVKEMLHVEWPDTEQARNEPGASPILMRGPLANRYDPPTTTLAEYLQAKAVEKANETAIAEARRLLEKEGYRQRVTYYKGRQISHVFTKDRYERAAIFCNVPDNLAKNGRNVVLVTTPFSLAECTRLDCDESMKTLDEYIRSRTQGPQPQP